MPDDEVRLRVSAELKSLATIRQFIEDQATRLLPDPGALADMVQAVDESASNIIVHGYDGQPGQIEVAVRQEAQAVVVCLRDQAPPFDPTQVLSPDLSLPLAERPVGGLGIHLTRQFVDELHYRALGEGGNELTLVKKLS